MQIHEILVNVPKTGLCIRCSEVELNAGMFKEWVFCYHYIMFFVFLFFFMTQENIC